MKRQDARRLGEKRSKVKRNENPDDVSELQLMNNEEGNTKFDEVAMKETQEPSRYRLTPLIESEVINDERQLVGR